MDDDDARPICRVLIYYAKSQNVDRSHACVQGVGGGPGVGVLAGSTRSLGAGARLSGGSAGAGAAFAGSVTAGGVVWVVGVSPDGGTVTPPPPGLAGTGTAIGVGNCVAGAEAPTLDTEVSPSRCPTYPAIAVAADTAITTTNVPITR